MFTQKKGFVTKRKHFFSYKTCCLNFVLHKINDLWNLEYFKNYIFYNIILTTKFFQIIQDKISGNWTFLAFFYSMCTNWPLHLDIYADKSPVPKSITKSASYPATHVSSVTKSLPQILLFLPFIHSLTESLPPLTSTYSKPRCKYSLNQNHHYCDQK